MIKAGTSICHYKAINLHLLGEMQFRLIFPRGQTSGIVYPTFQGERV